MSSAATTNLRSAVAVGREIEDQMMREIVSRMKRRVRRMPKGQEEGLQNFFSDLTRQQPRSKSYFRHVPRVARALAKAGAPLADVVAPLDIEKAAIIAECYADTLPPFDEALMMETNAQAAFDVVEMKMAEMFGRFGFIPKTMIAELEEAASAHANAIHVLQAVCLRYAR